MHVDGKRMKKHIKMVNLLYCCHHRPTWTPSCENGLGLSCSIHCLITTQIICTQVFPKMILESVKTLRIPRKGALLALTWSFGREWTHVYFPRLRSNIHIPARGRACTSKMCTMSNAHSPHAFACSHTTRIFVRYPILQRSQRKRFWCSKILQRHQR